MWNNHATTDALKRMLAARERVARRNPFFASLIFNARLEESERHSCIWTNGISIFFNPNYVTHKDFDGFIEGDFLECVMKCALLHFGRRKYRSMDKWNEASHLSVRPLTHEYFPQHPDLMAGDGLYPNKAVEEIYELLPDPPGDQGDGANGSEGEDSDPADQPGGMEDPSPEQEAEAEQAGKDWQRAVQNAKDKAIKAGNMPGNILRVIEELLPVEKLDWRDIIREMSRDAKSHTSRTWSRVNRRRNDPIMPGYGDDAIYNLVICFDVSGSIDNDQIKAMKTEVSHVLDENIITHATLIAVDTEPKSIEVVNDSAGVISWKPVGGGGTNFESALELINKDYPNAIGLVFLTDLETTSFGRKPPFPAVWVNFGHNKRLKAPYGRTVEY